MDKVFLLSIEEVKKYLVAQQLPIETTVTKSAKLSDRANYINTYELNDFVNYMWHIKEKNLAIFL